MMRFTVEFFTKGKSWDDVSLVLRFCGGDEGVGDVGLFSFLVMVVKVFKWLLRFVIFLRCIGLDYVLFFEALLSKCGIWILVFKIFLLKIFFLLSFIFLYFLFVFFVFLIIRWEGKLFCDVEFIFII